MAIRWMFNDHDEALGALNEWRRDKTLTVDMPTFTISRIEVDIEDPSELVFYLDLVKEKK